MSTRWLPATGSASLPLSRNCCVAWAENFNYVLRRASQDPLFAALGRAVAQSADDSDENIASEIQDQFEFGLERVLDGIEALLRTCNVREHN